MKKPTGLVVGLMSGTSGDGVDAALVEITGIEPGEMQISTRAATTIPYSQEFHSRLLDLCNIDTASVDEICRCNYLLGEEFARAVFSVCRQAGTNLDAVDLIGSHGQTIHHLPPAAEGVLGTPSTLQIGEPAVVAERTGITVVSGFRTRDMAAGGEGAPLVPFVDECLFRHATETRTVQNIGGIGNVTALPPAHSGKHVLAFDTGPGNMVIDALASELLGEPADWEGATAAQGRPDTELVQELLANRYFTLLPPKSTGRELFGLQFAAQLQAEGVRRGLSVPDIMATATAFTAFSIYDQYERFVVPHMGRPHRVIIGGGGAHNITLLAMLRRLMPYTTIQTHEDYGISGDAKEAIAFAVLAWRTWNLRPGNLPTATGAKNPVVLGSVTPGKRIPAWWKDV